MPDPRTPATLYTIGFTRHPAERFFGLIRGAGVGCIIDVRRRNTATLAGFSRRRDLPWFLKELCGAGYIHLPRLAPSEGLLDDYRGRRLTWEEFADRFHAQLERRLVMETLPDTLLDGACLLCSEPEPERCHRRLVAERFAAKLGNLRIEHLV